MTTPHNHIQAPIARSPSATISPLLERANGNGDQTPNKTPPQTWVGDRSVDGIAAAFIRHGVTDENGIVLRTGPNVISAQTAAQEQFTLLTREFLFTIETVKVRRNLAQILTFLVDITAVLKTPMQGLITALPSPIVRDILVRLAPELEAAFKVHQDSPQEPTVIHIVFPRAVNLSTTLIESSLAELGRSLSFEIGLSNGRREKCDNFCQLLHILRDPEYIQLLFKIDVVSQNAAQLKKTDLFGRDLQDLIREFQYLGLPPSEDLHYFETVWMPLLFQTFFKNDLITLRESLAKQLNIEENSLTLMDTEGKSCRLVFRELTPPRFTTDKAFLDLLPGLANQGTVVAASPDSQGTFDAFCGRMRMLPTCEVRVEDWIFYNATVAQGKLWTGAHFIQLTRNKLVEFCKTTQDPANALAQLILKQLGSNVEPAYAFACAFGCCRSLPPEILDPNEMKTLWNKLKSSPLFNLQRMPAELQPLARCILEGQLDFEGAVLLFDLQVFCSQKSILVKHLDAFFLQIQLGGQNFLTPLHPETALKGSEKYISKLKSQQDWKFIPLDKITLQSLPFAGMRKCNLKNVSVLAVELMQHSHPLALRTGYAMALSCYQQEPSRACLLGLLRHFPQIDGLHEPLAHFLSDALTVKFPETSAHSLSKILADLEANPKNRKLHFALSKALWSCSTPELQHMGWALWSSSLGELNEQQLGTESFALLEGTALSLPFALRIFKELQPRLHGEPVQWITVLDRLLRDTLKADLRTKLQAVFDITQMFGEVLVWFPGHREEVETILLEVSKSLFERDPDTALLLLQKAEYHHLLENPLLSDAAELLHTQQYGSGRGLEIVLRLNQVVQDNGAGTLGSVERHLYDYLSVRVAAAALSSREAVDKIEAQKKRKRTIENLAEGVTLENVRRRIDELFKLCSLDVAEERNLLRDLLETWIPQLCTADHSHHAVAILANKKALTVFGSQAIRLARECLERSLALPNERAAALMVSCFKIAPALEYTEAIDKKVRKLKLSPLATLELLACIRCPHDRLWTSAVEAIAKAKEVNNQERCRVLLSGRKNADLQDEQACINRLALEAASLQLFLRGLIQNPNSEPFYTALHKLLKQMLNDSDPLNLYRTDLQQKRLLLFLEVVLSVYADHDHRNLTLKEPFMEDIWKAREKLQPFLKQERYEQKRASLDSQVCHVLRRSEQGELLLNVCKILEELLKRLKERLKPQEDETKKNPLKSSSRTHSQTVPSEIDAKYFDDILYLTEKGVRLFAPAENAPMCAVTTKIYEILSYLTIELVDVYDPLTLLPVLVSHPLQKFFAICLTLLLERGSETPKLYRKAVDDEAKKKLKSLYIAITDRVDREFIQELAVPLFTLANQPDVPKLIGKANTEKMTNTVSMLQLSKYFDPEIHFGPMGNNVWAEMNTLCAKHFRPKRTYFQESLDSAHPLSELLQVREALHQNPYPAPTVIQAMRNVDKIDRSGKAKLNYQFVLPATVLETYMNAMLHYMVHCCRQTHALESSVAQRFTELSREILLTGSHNDYLGLGMKGSLALDLIRILIGLMRIEPSQPAVRGIFICFIWKNIMELLKEKEAVADRDFMTLLTTFIFHPAADFDEFRTVHAHLVGQLPLPHLVGPLDSPRALSQEVVSALLRRKKIYFSLLAVRIFTKNSDSMKKEEFLPLAGSIFNIDFAAQCESVEDVAHFRDLLAECAWVFNRVSSQESAFGFQLKRQVLGQYLTVCNKFQAHLPHPALTSCVQAGLKFWLLVGPFVDHFDFLEKWTETLFKFLKASPKPKFFALAMTLLSRSHYRDDRMRFCRILLNWAQKLTELQNPFANAALCQLVPLPEELPSETRETMNTMVDKLFPEKIYLSQIEKACKDLKDLIPKDLKRINLIDQNP